MTHHDNNNLLTQAMEIVLQEGLGGMSKAIEILLNEAMRVERERHLNAKKYERSAERTGYANGFKNKEIKTRVGNLNLQVPQVRECDFYPSALEKGLRSERALKSAVAEMYIQGVSTRKVQSIVGELCGYEVSSTEVSRCNKMLDEELDNWRKRRLGSYEFVFLDARYEKIRQDGKVLDAAVLVAVGIDQRGKREVLGVSIKLSEHEVHWRNFLTSLQERGLHGVKLVISDAHSGLKAARKAVFPSVPWQRCQFHLQQNAQSYVPKQSMKKAVAFGIRGIFNAPSLEEAVRLQKIFVEKYAKSAPKLANWAEENLSEGFTVFSFDNRYWRRLRTSNMVERLNREIARRTKVASIFPNLESCERLVTAIVMETSEEWQMAAVYLDVSEPGT